MLKNRFVLLQPYSSCYGNKPTSCVCETPGAVKFGMLVTSWPNPIHPLALLTLPQSFLSLLGGGGSVADDERLAERL